MSGGAIALAVGAGALVLFGGAALASAAPAAARVVTGGPPPPPPPKSNSLAMVGAAIVSGANTIGSALPHWGPGSTIGTKAIVCPSPQPGVKVGLSADDVAKGMIYLKALYGQNYRGSGAGACADVSALYNYSTKRFPWQA